MLRKKKSGWRETKLIQLPCVCDSAQKQTTKMNTKNKSNLGALMSK